MALFITYLFYIFTLIIVLVLFYQLLHKSEYGVLVFSGEFFAFIVPICIYPLFFYFDIFSTTATGQSLIKNYGAPGIFESIHIFLYVFSALIGYQFSSRGNSFLKAAFEKTARHMQPEKLFYNLVIFGLIVYVAFYLLVGVENILLHAKAARAGFVENYGEDQKYLFLKTFAKVSLYAVCFLPWFLYKKRSSKDRFFILLYLLLLIATYFANYGRGMWLGQLIIPIIIYARLNTSFSQFMKLVPVMLFGYMVLIYGKTLGHAISAYVQGETVVAISAYSKGTSFLETIFNNSSYAWFSVRAGFINFFEHGPLIPKDVVFSLWGFIPVNILDALNLKSLYYGSLSSGERLPCVNTEYFMLDNCTIPPQATGYSMYFMPFVGAILLGFFKFYLIGLYEKLWLQAKRQKYYMVAIPYFLYVLTQSFFNMIPSHVSLAAFTVVLIVLFMLAKKLVNVRG